LYGALWANQGGNGPQWITSCKSRYNLAVAPTPLLQSPTLHLLQKQGLSFVFIMARGDDTDPRPLMIANFALDCISNDFRDFITPQKQSTSTVQTWRHAQWDQIRKKSSGQLNMTLDVDMALFYQMVCMCDCVPLNIRGKQSQTSSHFPWHLVFNLPWLHSATLGIKTVHQDSEIAYRQWKTLQPCMQQ
jgi:hypothetical protein